MTSARYYFTRAHYFIVSLMNQDNSSFVSSSSSSSYYQYLQLFDTIVANASSSVERNGNTRQNCLFANANEARDKLYAQLREICKHKTLLNFCTILSFDLNKFVYSHNHRI